jgi:hypothetical protein
VNPALDAMYHIAAGWLLVGLAWLCFKALIGGETK